MDLHYRYQWTGNAGTHFWHSHHGLQKIDGIHGTIVVRQPPSRDPNSHLYDFDLTTHVMMLSDWFHEDAAERYPGRLAVNTGQDPESILINGKGQFRDPNTGFMTNTPLEVFTVTPGRRYRFRMINNFCTVCPAQLTIEGHSLTVIASDGEPVQPVRVDTIISFSGEFFVFGSSIRSSVVTILPILKLLSFIACCSGNSRTATYLITQISNLRFFANCKDQNIRFWVIEGC